MGCFDMYCCVCGGPFTAYSAKSYPNHPQMHTIDTEWLKDAIIEYNNGTKVSVCYYDGYGRFEDSSNVEYDVVEQEYNRELKVYHKLCDGKKPKTVLKKYQQQFFDIDLLIKQNNHSLLDKLKQ